MFDQFREEVGTLEIFLADLEGMDDENTEKLREELLTAYTQSNDYVQLYYNNFLKKKIK
jgi:hypothetical protein